MLGIKDTQEELATLPPPASYFQVQQSLLGVPGSLIQMSPLPLAAREPSPECNPDVSPTINVYTQEELSRRVTITTNFNATAKTHTKIPYPDSGPNRDNWTLAQRQHAGNVCRPETVEALGKKVRLDTWSEYHVLRVCSSLGPSSIQSMGSGRT